MTPDELEEAKISKKLARTIGIAVDHRRRNRCAESMQTNVNRFKLYKPELLIAPEVGQGGLLARLVLDPQVPVLGPGLEGGTDTANRPGNSIACLGRRLEPEQLFSIEHVRACLPPS